MRFTFFLSLLVSLFLFFVLLPFVCLPCQAHEGSAAQSLSVPVDPHFFDDPASGPVNATVTPLPPLNGIRVSRVTFPSPIVTPFAANNTVVAFLFEPSGPGPFPAMVVLHEWLPKDLGNENNMCEAIARAGVAALLMEEPYSLERRPVPHLPTAELLSPNLPQMVAGLRQTVIDARRCLDYLQTRPDINPQKLGVGGISLGAILAPLVIGADSRASVFLGVVGGSDVATIIWNSLFTRGIQMGMRQTNTTFSQLVTAMAPFEANRWVHGFNPQNALMFNGRDDFFIHPWEAEDMGRAFGGASIVWLNTGHYGVAFSINAIESTGAQFLRARFGLDSTPYHAPPSIAAHTIKLGFLLGGKETASLALAVQALNFDREGRYSLDGQLTFRGLSAALSARLNDTGEIGLEFPFFQGEVRPTPFALIHVVL